jgi:glycosyltransferase involved in cell wall biosynthesis
LCTRANGRLELQTPAQTTLNGVQVRYYNRLTGDHSHLSPALLWAVWQDCRKYDAVHIHSWWNLVAMPALLICLVRGVRPVVSPRGMLSLYTFQSRSKRLFHHLIGRLLLSKATLHATSEVEAQQIRKVVPKASVFTAPNLSVFPELLPFPPKSEALQILCIARIHPVKGLVPLFQALSTLSFPWQLTIAGTGDATYIQTLKTLTAQLDIAARIRWAGWVDGPEKYRLLAEADLFVLTSYSENFANAALEALAMGTPVLLGEAVGLADYVQQTGAGRVCVPEPEAIAAALNTLHAHIQGGGFDRAQIAQQVRTDFAPERIIAQYLDIYRHLSHRA